MSEKTRISRAGGIPVYAEDCDVTPNDELRELLAEWESPIQSNNPAYKRAAKQLREAMVETDE